MRGGRDGGVGAAARERQRDEELVGEVFADGGARGEVALRLFDDAGGYLLAADAALADAREDLGQVLALDVDGEDVAGADGRRVDSKGKLTAGDKLTTETQRHS